MAAATAARASSSPEYSIISPPISKPIASSDPAGISSRSNCLAGEALSANIRVAATGS
jgi:hypothetical protein